MNVAVIGAGVMGRNIAKVFARSGAQVSIFSRTTRTLGEARRSLDRDGVSLLTYLTSIAGAVDGADLVIESVPESVALKLEVLAETERSAPARAVIASNTSSLALDVLAGALERPARFLGLHWFNPAHLIPLVEVVATDATDQGVADWSIGLLTDVGKRPVVVPAIEGFLANRLQYALIREALQLIEDGVATAEQIDAVVTGCLGPRWAVIGPLRSTDLAGVETAIAVATQLFPRLSDAIAPQSVLSSLAESNRLGAAAGEGFFSYPSGSDVTGDRDRRLSAVLEVLAGGVAERNAMDG